MNRRILALSATLLATTLLTAIACGSDEETKTASTQSGTVSLEQDDFYFKPTEISGEVGKALQITLKNEGKATHTFTIDSLNIDQTVQPDETKTVTVTPTAKGD